MTTRVQSQHLVATAARPGNGTRPPGELWLNFPDYKLGAIDAAQAAVDLLAVRNYATTATYALGDYVVHAGDLLRAKTALTPHAFVAGEWDTILTLAQNDARYTTQTQNDARYLVLTGGTLTGNLAINPPTGGASLILKAVAGSGKVIGGLTGATPRWFLELGDSTAETGSNAGANFAIDRYNDAGAWLSSPITINRATGAIALNGTVTASDYIQATNAVLARGGNSYLGAGAAGVVLQFDPGWYLDWNATTKDMEWRNNNLGSGGFIARGDGEFWVNQAIHCSSTGVVYKNIGDNGFNFRWNGATAYIRVDNAVELGIQPISDERAKQDIAPSAFDCLAAVLATPLFEFKWKADPTVLVPIGFVAQRQYPVFPDSVTPGGADGASQGATTLWQMNHNTLCAALCGAVQQLNAKVEELMQRISILEGEAQP